MNDSGAHESSFAGGALLAAVSAVAFGVTTPLVQRLGHSVGPFTTAALLYGGATLSTLLPDRANAEPPLRREHALRLAVIAFFGAVLAPAALAWGLQRTSAAAASLLLATEVVFTVVLARLFFQEPVGGRVALAVVLMLAGATVLLGSGSVGGSALGALATVAAAAAWATDNVLTRPLADLDGRMVVRAKAGIGTAASLVCAVVLAEPMPSLEKVGGIVLVGAVGYGVSLRLYLAAQRRIGAARTGSVFATAPFVGAVAALGLGGARSLGAEGSMRSLGPAGVLFAVAIYLHLTERHRHRHRHEATEHEHLHRHDDGHHDHVHEPPFAGAHSHPHRHEMTVHDHPHAPDLHHQHTHDV